MIIGHFAIAFLLILLFPQVPFWVPLVGVAFPDLLWAVLLLTRKERVSADTTEMSPNGLVFSKYPYSHSLVLTNLIALGVGGILGLGLGDLMVIPVFVLASASHWVLDSLVHTPDLPILGFDGDRRVGFGLWRWGRTTFFLELALYVVLAAVSLPIQTLPLVLLVGVIFHAINAPSVFRPSRAGGLGSPKGLAVGALFVFGALSAILSILI